MSHIDSNTLFIFNLVFNPFGQLIDLIFSFVPFVSKNHEPIVLFISDDSAQTLGTLPHGIEDQEIFFGYCFVGFQVF